MLKWSHGVLLKTTLPYPPKSAHRSSGAVASLVRKEKQSMMLQDLVCSSDPTLPPSCSYWPRCSHRTNKVLLACSCPLNGLPAATPQHTCISSLPLFPMFGMWAAHFQDVSPQGWTLCCTQDLSTTFRMKSSPCWLTEWNNPSTFVS